MSCISRNNNFTYVGMDFVKYKQIINEAEPWANEWIKKKALVQMRHLHFVANKVYHIFYKIFCLPIKYILPSHYF